MKPSTLSNWRRWPLFLAILVGALTLVPGAWLARGANFEPPVAAGYAPWFSKPAAPVATQPTADQIENLLLNQWEFTATPSGIKPRR